MTERSPALTYSSYLALDEVLGAQRPRSDEHDEMLFIVIHRSRPATSHRRPSALAPNCPRSRVAELDPAAVSCAAPLPRAHRFVVLGVDGWWPRAEDAATHDDQIVSGGYKPPNRRNVQQAPAKECHTAGELKRGAGQSLRPVEGPRGHDPADARHRPGRGVEHDRHGQEPPALGSPAWTGRPPAGPDPAAGPIEASPVHDHLPCHETGEYAKPNHRSAREAIPLDEQARPCRDDPGGANGQPGQRLPVQDLRPSCGRRACAGWVAAGVGCLF